jgi:hypothetical protein
MTERMVALLKILQRGILALLTIVAVLGFTSSTSAQTITEARTLANQLFVDVALFNQALNQIGQDANLVMKKCRFARSAISRKKFFLNGLVLGTINAAITEANILDQNLDLLDDPDSEIDLFDQDVTVLIADVTALSVNGLDPTRATAIVNKLTQISSVYIPEIQTEISDLQSKSLDLLDILDDAQTNATPPGDLAATRTNLNECTVLLRDFDRERRTIVISKKSPILRLLNEIKGLLSSTGPLSEGTAVAAQAQRLGDVIDLGQHVGSVHVQVFTVDGRSLFTQEAPGHRLRLSGIDPHGGTLANGVYLYVLTARAPDGKILNLQVKKFIVQR